MIGRALNAWAAHTLRLRTVPGGAAHPTSPPIAWNGAWTRRVDGSTLNDDRTLR